MKEAADIFEEALSNLEKKVDDMEDGSNKIRLKRRLKGLRDVVGSVVLDVCQGDDNV